MQISGHYTGFPEKTLVIIMNHACARIFHAHAHDFHEQKTITSPSESSLDEAAIKTFFSLVHARMEYALAHEDVVEFLVCVPEIHRPLFQQHTPPALFQKIRRLVPKNLSAMEEGPIVRILFEG